MGGITSKEKVKEPITTYIALKDTTEGVVDSSELGTRRNGVEVPENIKKGTVLEFIKPYYGDNPGLMLQWNYPTGGMPIMVPFNRLNKPDSSYQRLTGGGRRRKNHSKRRKNLRTRRIRKHK